MHANVLTKSYFDTPLGTMLAIANDKVLYLLEFVERHVLESEIERLRVQTQSEIVAGSTSPLVFIQKELKKYFKGKLQIFKTPLCMVGTAFQKRAWEALCLVPYGKLEVMRSKPGPLARLLLIGLLQMQILTINSPLLCPVIVLLIAMELWVVMLRVFSVKSGYCSMKNSM
jgi:hypothetical protein